MSDLDREIQRLCAENAKLRRVAEAAKAYIDDLIANGGFAPRAVHDEFYDALEALKP